MTTEIPQISKEFIAVNLLIYLTALAHFAALSTSQSQASLKTTFMPHQTLTMMQSTSHQPLAMIKGQVTV